MFSFIWSPYVLTDGVQVASSATTSIALPAIGQRLNIPASELDWVVSAYTLSSVSVSRPLAQCLLVSTSRRRHVCSSSSDVWRISSDANARS
jgi:hypothetical protein